MLLTKETVDSAIERVKRRLLQYQIKPENLSKFGESEPDREFLSYINGTGGAYMKFIPLLIQELKLQNIVELGNREGLSTLAIYDNLPSYSSFITVDVVKDQRYCPNCMFTDPRVTFIFGDVCDLGIFDCLPSGIPTDIDFLFTDTIHFDFQLRDEWAIYKNLLADRALVAIDDINLNDKRKLFNELNYDKWDLTELCHTSGWGLFLFISTSSMSKEQKLLRAYQQSALIWKRKFYEAIVDKGVPVLTRLIAYAKKNMTLRKFLIKLKKFFGIIQ